MSSKVETKDWKKHTLIYPYAAVTFGQTTAYNCELTFEHRVNSEGNAEINIIGLTSTDYDGVTEDATHLVVDFDSTYTQFILRQTLGNCEHWDKKTVWWC